MVDPTIAIEGGLEVIRWTARRGIFKKGFDKLRPKYHVVVVGTSGAGKTNFLDSLMEPSARAIPRENRTKFSVSRTLILPKQSKPFVFYDTPGDRALLQERLRTFQKLWHSRRPYGVINVVAYGYNELIAVPASQAISQGLPDPQYLNRQRELEIDALSEWAPQVAASQFDYVITLVTKADLWFSDRIKVKNYYEHGEYADALMRLGINRRVVIEYASTIHKFFGTSVPGGFDLDDLLDLRKQFEVEMVNAVSR
ncbi:GTPase domain-containing protein [Mycobacterium colombiense]